MTYIKSNTAKTIGGKDSNFPWLLLEKHVGNAWYSVYDHLRRIWYLSAYFAFTWYLLYLLMFSASIYIESRHKLRSINHVKWLWFMHLEIVWLILEITFKWEYPTCLILSEKQVKIFTFCNIVKKIERLNRVDFGIKMYVKFNHCLTYAMISCTVIVHFKECNIAYW